LDHDDDGYCSVCKLRPLNARFPEAFREWVNNLIRLYLWHKAGYQIESEELDFEQWQTLAEITRYYEVKDAEAMLKASAGTLA